MAKSTAIIWDLDRVLLDTQSVVEKMALKAIKLDPRITSQIFIHLYNDSKRLDPRKVNGSPDYDWITLQLYEKYRTNLSPVELRSAIFDDQQLYTNCLYEGSNKLLKSLGQEAYQIIFTQGNPKIQQQKLRQNALDEGMVDEIEIAGNKLPAYEPLIERMLSRDGYKQVVVIDDSRDIIREVVTVGHKRGWKPEQVHCIWVDREDEKNNEIKRDLEPLWTRDELLYIGNEAHDITGIGRELKKYLQNSLQHPEGGVVHLSRA